MVDTEMDFSMAAIIADVEEYARGEREPAREQQIGQQLRKLPEEHRFEIIQQLINGNPVIGLSLARKSLDKPKFFEKLLVHGIEDADPQDIDLWLRTAFGPLHFVRMYDVLTKALSNNSEAVEQALHVMPQFFRPNSTRQSILYRQLLESLYGKASQDNNVSEWLGAQARKWNIIENHAE